MVEAQGTTGADEPPIQSVGRLGKNTDHSCSQYICELPNVQLYRPCILIVFFVKGDNAHWGDHIDHYDHSGTFSQAIKETQSLWPGGGHEITFWGKRVSTLVSVKPCHGLVISAAHQNTSNQTTGKGGPKTRARYVFTLRLGLCGWDNMVEN